MLNIYYYYVPLSSTPPGSPLSCIHCGLLLPTADELSLVQHCSSCPGSPGTGPRLHYICYACPYRTAHRNSIGRHVRIHTGRKPHACVQCNYSTINLYDLKRHMLRHTGAKPYACGVCSFRTNQKCNLTTHMRLRHGERRRSAALVIR